MNMLDYFLGFFGGSLSGLCLGTILSKYLARRADMVQPLVSPPDAGELVEEPAALARRLILAELRTFVKYEHESVDFIPTDSLYVDGARDAYDTVLERLEMLLGTEGQDAP